MSHLFRRFILPVICLFWITYSSVYAQAPDSVRYGLLPSLSFNSDTRINVAFDLLRFNYGQGQVPFKNFGTYRVSYNGLGAFSAGFQVDQVRTFGTDIRSFTDGLVIRNDGNYFLGNTLDQPFSRALFDTTSFYQFRSFLLNLGVSTRIPIGDVEGIKRTDIKIGARVVHEQPFDLESNSFFAVNRPTGVDGATISFLETAYIVERRDSEFRARTGYYGEIGLKLGLPVISTQTIAALYGDLRLYQKIIDKGDVPQISFAQRIRFDHTFGDLPYWFTPSLGGAGGLRGFIWRRFSADNAFLSITEIRTWLVKLPIRDIRLGLNGFIDAGSVYNRSFTDWDPRVTYGFGGFLSSRNRDFILKYEIGFSEEGSAIYIGTGYSF